MNQKMDVDEVDSEQAVVEYNSNCGWENSLGR